MICSGFVLCSRFVNGKSGDISLAEGAIRRFPRIMIPSAFAALLYWAIFHWSSLDGRVCHQVGFWFLFAFTCLILNNLLVTVLCVVAGWRKQR